MLADYFENISEIEYELTELIREIIIEWGRFNNIITKRLFKDKRNWDNKENIVIFEEIFEELIKIFKDTKKIFKTKEKKLTEKSKLLKKLMVDYEVNKEDLNLTIKTAEYIENIVLNWISFLSLLKKTAEEIKNDDNKNLEKLGKICIYTTEKQKTIFEGILNWPRKMDLKELNINCGCKLIPIYYKEKEKEESDCTKIIVFNPSKKVIEKKYIEYDIKKSILEKDSKICMKSMNYKGRIVFNNLSFFHYLSLFIDIINWLK